MGSRTLPVSEASSSLNNQPTSKMAEKHNLATTVDKEKVLEAYNDVMSDAKADINWAFFNYTDSKIGVRRRGKNLPISKLTSLPMTVDLDTSRLSPVTSY